MGRGGRRVHSRGISSCLVKSPVSWTRPWTRKAECFGYLLVLRPGGITETVPQFTHLLNGNDNSYLPPRALRFPTFKSVFSRKDLQGCQAPNDTVFQEVFQINKEHDHTKLPSETHYNVPRVLAFTSQ